jgi:hypothetical protein
MPRAFRVPRWRRESCAQAFRPRDARLIMLSMQRRLLALQLCLLWLVVSACAGDDTAAMDTDAGDAEPGAGKLTVLSYNVAGLPQEFSGENPKEHLPLISPLLADYPIVLTQEDFDWWVPALDGFDFVHYHERLRMDADHAYRTERHPGPEAVGLDLSMHDAPSVGDGLGFLSRYPFDGVVRVPWKSCFGGATSSDMGAGDCLAMKGFMVGTFTLAKGVEVDIYTLHLEAGATTQDQALQAADMLDLAAFMKKHSAGRAVIIAGDTNLHTAGDHPDASGKADGEIWAKFLKATELTDSCTVLKCKEPGAIDKLAYRSSAVVALEALTHRFETERFVDEAVDPLSDHDALAVT